MKKIFLILILLNFYIAQACPVCERNKPKLLQGITHSGGAESKWDYVIVIAMIVIVIATLFYSIKWLIKPNENNVSHIKYSFLNKQ
jgi:hypothetical protein